MDERTTIPTVRVGDLDYARSDFLHAGCVSGELEVVDLLLERGLKPGQRGVWKLIAELLGTGKNGQVLSRTAVGMRWQGILTKIRMYAANGRRTQTPITVGGKVATYDTFLLALCSPGELATIRVLIKHGVNPETAKGRFWKGLAAREIGTFTVGNAAGEVHSANWRRACARVRRRRLLEQASCWKLMAHGYQVRALDFERVNAPVTRLMLIRLLTKHRLQPGDYHVWRVMEYLLENGRAGNGRAKRGITKSKNKRAYLGLMWRKAVELLQCWPRLHDGTYLIPIDGALGGTHYATLEDFRDVGCTERELDVVEQLASPDLIRGTGWQVRVARILTQQRRRRDLFARAVRPAAVSARYLSAVRRLRADATWSGRSWEECEWIGTTVKVRAGTPVLFSKSRR